MNNIEKDSKYWQIHKEVYLDIINTFDLDIADKIWRNPTCAEAKLLNKKVEEEIKKKLQESTA